MYTILIIEVPALKTRIPEAIEVSGARLVRSETQKEPQRPVVDYDIVLN